MSSPSLSIVHQTVGHVLIVRVAGEIDLVTAPDFQAGLNEATAKARPPETVVADLSGVEFMGSSGLAVLMDVDEQCRGQRTPFRIVATTPGVVRPLTVTGLDRVLDIVGSLDIVIRSA